ncbi:CFEM-domain-containing protein, partial [Lepidopterella palustris CBS 459.81]
FAAIALALASVATAQLANIPNCALNCFVNALTTDGCSGLTDFACHCKKTDLISNVTPCVQAACSADDQAKVITAVEGTCASAGVPISVPPV